MTPTTLAQLLTDHDITPRQLAERLGVTKTTVYNWLGGRTPITQITAMAIQVALADHDDGR